MLELLHKNTFHTKPATIHRYACEFSKTKFPFTQFIYQDRDRDHDHNIVTLKFLKRKRRPYVVCAKNIHMFTL